jgi:hypothetical protein
MVVVAAGSQLVDQVRPERVGMLRGPGQIAVVLHVAVGGQNGGGEDVDVLLRQAAEDPLLLRQFLVDADMPLVAVVDAAGLADEVAGRVRGVRQGEVGQDLLRCRMEAVLRDLVAGERLPYVAGEGERIVDRGHAAEIAVAHGCRGHVAARGGGGADTLALVVEEEERAIADDAPAERAAELVIGQRVHPNVKVLPGVEVVVAQELEQRAVEVVRAGLNLQVDHPAGRAAILGRVVAGLKAELADGLGGGDHHGQAEHDGVVVDAVDHPVVLVGRLAVDRDRRSALPGGDGRVAPAVGAGNQQAELHEMAAVERKLFDLGLFDQLVDRGGLRVDHRRAGGHGDGLRHLPGLKGDVDARRLVDGKLNGVGGVLLEAGHLNAHAIGAHGKRRQHVVAGTVGFHRANGVGGQVDRLDRYIRDDGSGLVADRADNAAGLGVQATASEQESSEQCAAQRRGHAEAPSLAGQGHYVCLLNYRTVDNPTQEERRRSARRLDLHDLDGGRGEVFCSADGAGGRA